MLCPRPFFHRSNPWVGSQRPRYFSFPIKVRTGSKFSVFRLSTVCTSKIVVLLKSLFFSEESLFCSNRCFAQMDSKKGFIQEDSSDPGWKVRPMKDDPILRLDIRRAILEAEMREMRQHIRWQSQKMCLELRDLVLIERAIEAKKTKKCKK